MTQDIRAELRTTAELLYGRAGMRQLAAALGVPFPSLRDWVYGRRQPRDLHRLRADLAALRRARIAEIERAG